MTVMIVKGTGDGQRRCDERCYNAKGKRCTCVCGGKNHGVGQEQANKNTKEMAEVYDGDDEEIFFAHQLDFFIDLFG